LLSFEHLAELYLSPVIELVLGNLISGGGVDLVGLNFSLSESKLFESHFVQLEAGAGLF
jgi:hypothetical protein